MGHKLLLCRNRWDMGTSVVEIKAQVLATSLDWVHGGVSGLDSNLAQVNPMHPIQGLLCRIKVVQPKKSIKIPLDSNMNFLTRSDMRRKTGPKNSQLFTSAAHSVHQIPSYLCQKKKQPWKGTSSWKASQWWKSNPKFIGLKGGQKFWTRLVTACKAWPATTFHIFYIISKSIICW